MKHSHIYVLLIVLLLSAFTACRTTEENYRQAYEKAIERDQAGLDSTIYNNIRRAARPAQVVVDGDTVNMRREYVRVTENEGTTPENLKMFSVVAGQFKQVFHARSMRNRIIDRGYTEAFIVETREPLYYVVALSSDTLAEARQVLDQLSVDPPFTLREPCPWILRRN